MQATQLSPSETNPFLGINEKDKQRYSLVRAIRTLSEYGKLEGLEKELSDAVEKRNKKPPMGFYVPADIMAAPFNRVHGDTLAGLRALNATTATAGGFLVGTETQSSNMIELLRNKMVVTRLGCRVIDGLIGNVAIPRQTGGATAYWLAEGASVTASDQSLGQIIFTPHRLAGLTYYSKQLLIQTSPSIESFVREDLATTIAAERDRAALNGIGAAGEPLGIMNTTGVNSITFGGAAVWQDMVDAEILVEDDNVDLDGTAAYVTTPTAKGKLKTAVKVSGQAQFLWQDNFINGYPALSTKQVPDDRMIFGKWSDLILAGWDGLDILVDPYSMATTGQSRITVNMHCDSGTRYPQAFTVSTDSAAQ